MCADGGRNSPGCHALGRAAYCERTPLHIAAYDGSLVVVRLLVARRAELELRDGFGKTALHLACETVRGRLSVIELLLDSGAEVNPLSTEGVTPLMLACYANSAAARAQGRARRGGSGAARSAATAAACTDSSLLCSLL